MINGHTRVHALYGHPVFYSFSPMIFNGIFEKQGLNRAYLAFDVPPEKLPGAVAAAKALGIEGFNVTMPHKAAILPLLDRIDPAAEEMGSVNTVANSPQGLEGYSTDGEGALKALKTHGFDPQGRRIMIIGAGGAARAIAHRLSGHADEISVFDRSQTKAETIVDRIHGHAKTTAGPLSRTAIENGLRGLDLLIDATPVSTSVLLESLGVSLRTLPHNLWLFELAYDKPTRPLPGVRQIHPLEMLLQQAAISYEIWLGRPAPLEQMRTILARHNEDWK